MSSPPTTLGKYQIIREIARSNDIVYEAYDPLMNRRVALKELSMPNGSTPQQREERVSRFKREARAAGTLAHPNIMTVYELGEEGDRFYIAMEFLDGHTLRNELDTKGALPIGRAVEIAEDVLRGLEFMHGKGVIHRDIKPDNIQILSDGRIKLTDFGIARLTFEPNLTMDGQVFGTPSYMSPEQVVGREIDARSDLFSLGIVLYEMIGGRKPFTGDSVVSITYAIMNKEAERLSEANYALWQVIERALDKSPALRFASADEFETALKAAQEAASAGPVLDVTAPPPMSSYGAVGNPYMMPTPGMAGPPSMYNQPTAPPVLYTYNPYTGQPGTPPPLQPTTGAYMNSAYVPNPTGMPIYYAPPPRPPLFKPETKAFMGKLMIAMIVGIAIFGVLLVLIKAISETMNSGEAEQHDQRVVASLNADIQGRPISEQISVVEKVLDPDPNVGKLRGSVTRRQEEEYAARLHEERGERYYANRDYERAERDLLRATDLDPENSAYYRDLGEVYSRYALELGNARDSVLAWGRSSQNYIHAAEVERDPEVRTRLQDGAARATYNYATQLYLKGSFVDAREQLEAAKGFALPNTEISTRIDSMLEMMPPPPTDLDSASQAPVHE
ncbi:MAG: protein kinase domain-containing protein [Fimbriimonadaceae bacterium]